MLYVRTQVHCASIAHSMRSLSHMIRVPFTCALHRSQCTIEEHSIVSHRCVARAAAAVVCIVHCAAQVHAAHSFSVSAVTTAATAAAASAATTTV
jgi:hypothetical protein